MIPKYKYKYQDQRHAGSAIQYCRFELHVKGRMLLPSGWIDTNLILQRFEVYTPTARHVDYDKPVMTEPKIHKPEEDNIAEPYTAETKHVNKLIVYDVDEIWKDFQRFFEAKDTEEDPHYVMIEREGVICRRK